MLAKVLSLAIGVVAATLACGAEPSDLYSGRYFYNFENAYLTPKGKDECWALKGNMTMAELPGKNGAPPWGSADVVLRGLLSAPGHFGNLGACTRLLTISKIVEVRNKVQR